MTDGIKELQFKAAEWISKEKLEGEFNKYWSSNKSLTGYLLIDFVMEYCMQHSDEIRRSEG